MQAVAQVWPGHHEITFVSPEHATAVLAVHSIAPPTGLSKQQRPLPAGLQTVAVVQVCPEHHWTSPGNASHSSFVLVAQSRMPIGATS